ncbi:hypothetical protein [Gordonia tangerina]|uniref:Uncharacterized protein n=1 Tax=Gordonia tangerina TaxID=2911060 RepID=A0ABS9DQD4_9ACTN|nr:hypothetical protein [Gordonia tangerina]MCF3941440.1 hypothetical protein [Gordonia tangerina]
MQRNVVSTVNLVSSHSGSTGEFKGLMSALKVPVDTLCEATVTRQSTLSPALHGTSVSLKQAAWDYTSTDREAGIGIARTTYQEYNSNPFITQLEVDLGLAENPVTRVPVVEDVPGAKSLAAPREIDVDAPPNESVDWNALISETAGCWATPIPSSRTCRVGARSRRRWIRLRVIGWSSSGSARPTGSPAPRSTRSPVI